MRELSLQLFDQLQPIHHLPADARVVLEAGALLHDIGHSVSHKGHHKHGEYLTMNGDVPGLEGRNRALAAAVVRYHNRKAEPAEHHISYGSLNNNDRRLARKLASMVRIAEGLDHSHRERIQRIRATFQNNAVGLQLEARGDASEDVRDANRSAELFEKEFHTRLFFRPLNK